LHREQQKGVERLANTLLLKDLLREGRLKEAGAEADAAAPLASDTNDKMGTLPLTIAVAQVRAALGNTAEAKKTLRTALDMANRYGFVEYAFEARLALGQVETQSGSAAGRARLQALQKEAQARGFGEIAKQAQQSLNVSVTSDAAALH
jgi:hypothetical protein